MNSTISPCPPGVDSRQYRIAFPIETLSEVPADFVLPPDFGTCESGVFLPRDDAGWLGRRGYPPRVLLLSGREVLVIAHPSAGDQPVRVILDRVARAEWGRILLVGWFAMTWNGGQIHLPYNTRSRGPIEKCLRTIEDRWLPESSTPRQSSALAFGRALDLKFQNAGSAELLAGETPLAQLFQSPDRRMRRWWFGRSQRRPGDLVWLTARRLLWITERHKGGYLRYGTVSHSARLSSVAAVRCIRIGRQEILEIAHRDGPSWSIPLDADRVEDARKFGSAASEKL